MKRHEYRVRTNVRRDSTGECRGSAAGSKNHSRTLDEPVAPGNLRMNFGERRRLGLYELRYPPRLRSGLVVSEHAACRQVERKFLVRNFRRAAMFNSMKTCAAARRRKRGFEQARCTGVMIRGAGPEHAV